MSLLINLTPVEEAQLSTAARQTGLAPEAFAEQLVREHLPAVSPMEKMRQKLQEWQKQDATPISQPIVSQAVISQAVPARSGLTPTAALFEQWAEEDAGLTDEERETEAKVWEGFEEALIRNGRIRL